MSNAEYVLNYETLIKLFLVGHLFICFSLQTSLAAMIVCSKSLQADKLPYFSYRRCVLLVNIHFCSMALVLKNLFAFSKN